MNNKSMSVEFTASNKLSITQKGFEKSYCFKIIINEFTNSKSSNKSTLKFLREIIGK